MKAGLRQRVIADERGIALVMALGIMIVCGIMTVTVIEYTSTTQRTAHVSKARLTAFDAADAGMNNAVAVLNLPSNNALHQDILPPCHTTNPNPGNGTGQTPNSTWFSRPTNFASRSTWNHNTYSTATVDWCGDLDLSANQWYLWSIGYLRNPTGTRASATSRTLTAKVSVVPNLTQPNNNPSWNFIYATHTGSACDQTLSNNVGGSSKMYIQGNLCIGNNAGVTASTLIVRGNLDLSNNTFVGASTSMSTRVETFVGGNCRYQRNGTAWVTPCQGNRDGDNIFSKYLDPDGVWRVGVSNTPPTVTPPSADFAAWYQNAMPGPRQGCTTSSGTPPTFDNNTTRDNSVSGVFDLTPTSSYVCRVGPGANTTITSALNATQTTISVASASGFPSSGTFRIRIDDEQMNVTAGAGTTTWTVQRGYNGTVATTHATAQSVLWDSAPTDGEISWNATTRSLTVKGTLYIDGSVKIGNNALNTYNGQATVYVSGTLLIDGQLCGGVSGSSCDFSAWNPNTEMLTFVVNGTGGQVNPGNSIQVNNNFAFQGGLFATGNVEYLNNAYSDGPIMGSEIKLANNVTTSSFPTITTIPVGMPGSNNVYAQPNPPQSFSG